MKSFVLFVPEIPAPTMITEDREGDSMDTKGVCVCVLCVCVREREMCV